MRGYGKVSPRFWSQGTGRKLRGDPDAQLLALYLMTCPASSMTGIFVMANPTMAYETGLSLARVTKACARLEEEGFAVFDHDSDLVWVVRMARYQIGDFLTRGDNRRLGVEKELASFRGHRFVPLFLKEYEGAYDLSTVLPLPPTKGLTKDLESTSGGTKYQDQDQDQDQEQEQDQKEVPLTREVVVSHPVAKETTEANKIREVFAHYRAHHPRSFPLARAESKEWRLVRERLRDGHSVEDLKLAIDGYHRDPFHCGKNDRNAKYLDLDLIVRDASHVAKGIEFTHVGPRAPPPSTHSLCAFHVETRNANKRAHRPEEQCSECKHVKALERRTPPQEPTPVGEIR